MAKIINEKSFVEFDENIAIAKLNNLNGKEIGGNNVLYYLRVDKLDSKNITMGVWSFDKLMTRLESCRLGDFGRKITNKKNPMIQDLIDLFGGEELPSDVDQKLKVACREIQERWLSPSKTGKPDFADSDGKHIVGGNDNFSPERKERATELLLNPNILDIIDEELEVYIKGEVGTRLYLFLSFLQSFTPKYLQVRAEAESAAGKTWLFMNTLRVFPEESFKVVGRLSRTALERVNFDPSIKLLFIQEGRGGEAAADSIRLSSTSDGGMVALITDPNNIGEVREFRMRGLSIVTTSTSLIMHNEDSTRSIRINLDETIEQTKKVVAYEGYIAEYPIKIQEFFKLIDNDRVQTIKDAIRLLDQNIKVIIPFGSEVAKILDDSKLRIKRDFGKIIGHIETLAWLRQLQREILEINGEKWVIATIKDFEDVVYLCEKHLTRTYFDMSDEQVKLFLLIKGLEREIEWNDRKIVGVHTSMIADKVREQMKMKSADWLSKRLNLLVDLGVVIKTWIAQPPQGMNFGYYYRTISDLDYTSIFKERPLKENLEKRIEEWRTEYIERSEKNGIKINFIFPEKNIITLYEVFSD